MIIAVDFDGTIVDHEYPKIGKEKLFAFQTLKQLCNRGHKLILWTYRSGELLLEAVDYCAENGIEFYAVNNSTPGEQFESEYSSRKIAADIFIDDRNVGGFPGWSKIWEELEGDSYQQSYASKEKDILKENVRYKILRFFGFGDKD
ncbi:MAG: hydrolase [Bacteroidota bacterium]|nr:hydrolase [Bacteroidota bacterium]